MKIVTYATHSEGKFEELINNKYGVKKPFVMKFKNLLYPISIKRQSQKGKSCTIYSIGSFRGTPICIYEKGLKKVTLCHTYS